MTGVSVEQDMAFAIYPNPAGAVLNVRIDGNDAEAVIQVYDLTGKLILQNRGSGDAFSIDATTLKPGIYLVRASINGAVYTRRVVKL